LAGAPVGPPPAIPRAAPRLAAGGRDLTAMTVRFADLPGGFLPIDQGFERDRRVLAIYTRSFGGTNGPRPVRGALLTALESRVELSFTPMDAVSRVDVLGAMSARALRSYGRTLVPPLGAGADPDVRVRRLRAPAVGDRAVALAQRTSVGVLVVDDVLVYFRVGPLIGTVVGYGPPGRVRPAAVIALAREQAARMRAGLAAPAG
jgi:hypothetical protein